MMKICINPLILILLHSALAQEGPHISGVLSGDTRWEGLVYISGDITVPRGVTLTIAPGTRVLMNTKMDREQSGDQRERIEINVLGTLIADAYNSNAPVVFTSGSKQQQMHDWYGIVFKPSSSHSLLRNCIVEYGYIAVSCYGASPKLEDSIFRYNYLAGVNCEVRANPVIKNSLLLDNGFAGINCELLSSPLVLNCVIAQNGNGVVVYDRSQPDLGRINPRVGESSGENRIFNNFDYDIYNRSELDIFAQNNFWKSNRVEEIRTKLYDRTNMPQYGEVIFQPFRTQTFETFTSLPESVEWEMSSTEGAGLTPRVAAPLSGTPSKPVKSPADAAQNVPSLIAVPPDSQQLSVPGGANSSALLSGAPGTLKQSALPPEFSEKTEAISDDQLPDAGPSRPTQPQAMMGTSPSSITSASGIQEPVIESFLDSGQREYISRNSPQYPAAYQGLGTEGVVLMEVVVGRDGRVQSYRTLRSDGKAFTEAAIAALENTRYKAGTVNGQPVSFKAIERFIFKLD